MALWRVKISVATYADKTVDVEARDEGVASRRAAELQGVPDGCVQVLGVERVTIAVPATAERMLEAGIEAADYIRRDNHSERRRAAKAWLRRVARGDETADLGVVFCFQQSQGHG